MKTSVALRLGRVSNLPTVASNVLTGLVLSRREIAIGDALGLVFAMAAFYTGGMFLNDAFDRGWDAKHRPERPIPAGEATAKQVFVYGFAMLALGLLVTSAVAWAHGASALRQAGALSLLLGLTITLYDAWHKANPIGPWLMAACRALIYATVCCAVGGALDGDIVPAAVALLGYLFGLTYLAKQETLQRPASFWPLALLVAPWLLAAPRALDFSIVCFVVLSVETVRALRCLLPGPRRHIGRAVGQLIAGIALVDALLVAPRAPVLAACCLLAYVLTRLLQRRIAGT